MAVHLARILPRAASRTPGRKVYVLPERSDVNDSRRARDVRFREAKDWTDFG
jgi:hypothetical protein